MNKTKKYTPKIGSRAQVFNGTALRTSGGLSKKDLVKNKHNRIVSLKKRNSMRKYKNNPLAKGGYIRTKGDKQFGPKNKKTKKSSIISNFFNLF